MGDAKEVQISTEKQQKNSALQKGMKTACLFFASKGFRILELNGEF